MKLYLKKVESIDSGPFDHSENLLSIGFLTVGRIYDGQKVPTMYDTITLQPVSPCYIIKCNDSQWRKVDSSFFMTLEEFRSLRLNELGI